MKERYEVEESESGASARPDAPTVATDERRPQLSSSSATAGPAASMARTVIGNQTVPRSNARRFWNGRAARGPYAEFIVNAN